MRPEDERVHVALDDAIHAGLVKDGVGSFVGASVTMLMFTRHSGLIPTQWMWFAASLALGMAHIVLHPARHWWPVEAWRRAVTAVVVTFGALWPLSLLAAHPDVDRFDHSITMLFGVLAASTVQTVSFAAWRRVGAAALAASWVVAALVCAAYGLWILMGGCVVIGFLLNELQGRSHDSLLAAIVSGFVADDLRREASDREREAHIAARTDPVTGLNNRLGLNDHIAALGSRPVPLIFVDLDRFKEINDRMGHVAGDELVAEIGRRLGSLPGLTAARIGGDEFVLIADDIAEGMATAQADAHSVEADSANRGPVPPDLFGIAQSVLAEIGRPVVIDDVPTRVSASIGVAVGTGAEALDRADMAMYRAKAAGRGQVVVFDAQMQVADDAARQTRTDLERALTSGADIEVWGQPIFGVGDGRPVAVEMLSRWNRAGSGVIPPLEWIPLVEELGAMDRLGRLVIDRAVGFLAEVDDIEAWINIGPAHLLGGGVLGDIVDAASRHGVDPSRVTIEITESVFIEDRRSAAEIVTGLRRQGIGVALDDFGSGYSSLGYLVDLDVSAVKLDRAFVRDVDRSTRRQAMVRAIVELSRALGLVVVAEGVERADEHAQLVEVGVDCVQGFFHARPTELARLVAPMRRSTSTA